MLFQSNFKSLHLIINEELLVLIHKLMNKSLQNTHNFTQVHDKHSYSTRQGLLFDIKYFRSNHCQNNIYYRGMQAFNLLPSNIRQEQNLFKFKLKLREYFKMQKVF